MNVSDIHAAVEQNMALPDAPHHHGRLLAGAAVIPLTYGGYKLWKHLHPDATDMPDEAPMPSAEHLKQALDAAEREPLEGHTGGYGGAALRGAGYGTAGGVLLGHPAAGAAVGTLLGVGNEAIKRIEARGQRTRLDGLREQVRKFVQPVGQQYDALAHHAGQQYDALAHHAGRVVAPALDRVGGNVEKLLTAPDSKTASLYETLASLP